MNYHMLSRRGNQKVVTLVNEVVDDWRAGRPRDAILARLYQEYLQIDEDHPEISDTQVRETIDQFLRIVGAPDWLILAVWDTYYFTHSTGN